MPVPRWLLQLVLALVTIGASVTGWAAAGVMGDACCCPDARKCKCHDHDGKTRQTTEMKSCGSGTIQHTAPATTLAITQPIAIYATMPAAIVRAQWMLVPMPEDRVREPETPPF